jgi:hypothetical protein
MIFRKYYRGGIFPIQVLQVEGFDSASMKKDLSRFRPDGKDLKVLYYRHKISIGSPWCRGPQGTLTDWLGAVIDSNVI